MDIISICYSPILSDADAAMPGWMELQSISSWMGLHDHKKCNFMELKKRALQLVDWLSGRSSPCKGTFFPFPIPLPFKWVYSDLCHLLCYHTFRWIQKGGSGPERGIGYPYTTDANKIPFPTSTHPLLPPPSWPILPILSPARLTSTKAPWCDDCAWLWLVAACSSGPTRLYDMLPLAIVIKPLCCQNVSSNRIGP